ncbi:MAG: PH domain-containing protein [Ruminococcus sp.]|nr:PH domain-containing protein [Ruminococcus sp.]
MKRYLPAKRAMLTFYLLLAAGGTALNVIIYRYVTVLPEEYLRIVSMCMWGFFILIAAIVIPHYFICAKFMITKKEIASVGGFFSQKSDYMPISSVKSVSVIITPLGILTGFNFVTINALGARMVFGFLRKTDAKDIAATVNELIRESEGDAV